MGTMGFEGYFTFPSAREAGDVTSQRELQGIHYATFSSPIRTADRIVLAF